MSPLLRRDDRVGEGERWAVVRKIGDGGFAEVYEVRDTLDDDAQVRVSKGGVTGILTGLSVCPALSHVGCVNTHGAPSTGGSSRSNWTSWTGDRTREAAP